jgi:hypothetical protein
LENFRGAIHARGYAGFNELFAGGSIVDAACWAHVRRKFLDVHAAIGRRGPEKPSANCRANPSSPPRSLDNNPAKRALRCIAIGRKNYLFAGSDAGGRRAAATDSLIETARVNDPTRSITSLTWSHSRSSSVADR